VTHNYQDTGGYGGEGIYLDNITSNVLVQNNLVYRTSEAAIFNNKGANNTWTNNILAYGREGAIKKGGLEGGRRRQQQQQRMREQGPGRPGAYGRRQRRQWPGGNPPEDRGQRRQPGAEGRPQQQEPDPDKPAFIFTRNIVLLGRGPIQKVPGFWTCMHPNREEEVPCRERFDFDYNLYWNQNRSEARFATSDPENPRRANQHSLKDWQELGEDVHSLIADPRFADPNYPADDFTLLPDSPAEEVGFVPFDYKQAGLTTPLPRPSAQPPAFPLQLLNPASDF